MIYFPNEQYSTFKEFKAEIHQALLLQFFILAVFYIGEFHPCLISGPVLYVPSPLKLKLAVFLFLAEAVTGDHISQFIRDLTLATGIPRFECIICGHTTKERSNLRKHVSYVHGSHQEEICPVCDRVYKNKSSLKAHMRLKSCSKSLSC